MAKRKSRRRSAGTLFRRGQSEIWTARYTDEDGRRVDRTTGCISRSDAEAVLSRWVSEARRLRVEMPDRRARKAVTESRRPIGEHIKEYIEQCRHEGQNKRAVDQKEAHVQDFIAQASVGTLGEIDTDAVESWLRGVKREGGGLGKSARTVNHHRQSLVAFLSWCVERGRLRDNPAVRVKPLNEERDKRRDRRALTPAEVARLFAVAAERGRLAWYACAYYAGLRRGDLLRLEWRDIVFSRDNPSKACIVVREGKSGHEDTVSLEQTLSAILSDRLRQNPGTPRARVFPEGVTDNTRRADFARAGIPERDDAGKVADLHALRTTLCTHLAKGGAEMPVVQRIMRHRNITTTSKAYTKLGLVDTAEAFRALPTLPSAELRRNQA